MIWCRFVYWRMSYIQNVWKQKKNTKKGEKYILWKFHFYSITDGCIKSNVYEISSSFLWDIIHISDHKTPHKEKYLDIWKTIKFHTKTSNNVVQLIFLWVTTLLRRLPSFIRTCYYTRVHIKPFYDIMALFWQLFHDSSNLLVSELRYYSYLYCGFSWCLRHLFSYSNKTYIHDFVFLPFFANIAG